MHGYVMQNGETGAVPRRSSRDSTEPRLARNSITSLAGNAWSIVLGIVSTPLLLNGLGATGFGLWAILQAFSATTGWFSLADLGLGPALVREAAHRHAHGDRSARAVESTGLILLSTIAVALGVAFCGIALLSFDALFEVPTSFSREFRVAVVASSIQIVMDLIGRGMQAVLEGRGRLDLARVAAAIRRTLSIGGASWAALASGGLGTTVTAAATGSLIGLAITVGMVLRSGHLAPGFDVTVARTIGRTARSFAALNGVGVLHRTMDRLIVGIIFGPTTVVVVEIAGQIQVGLTSLLTAIAYPGLSAAPHAERSSGIESLRQLARRLTRWCVTATCPALITVVILIDPLLEVWLGRSDPELRRLCVLAVAYVAISMFLAATSYVLQGLGRADRLVRPSVYAVAANVIVSVGLAKVLGVDGVFIATLFAAGLLGVGIDSAVRSALQCSLADLIQPAVRTGVVLGTAAGCGSLVGHTAGSPIAQLLLGTGCSVMLVLATVRWTLEAEEVDRLRRRLRRER